MAMIHTDNLGVLFDPELGGDRLALIDCRDWATPRQFSHREIHNLADACARGLLGRGYCPGDSVAILSSNRAEFLIAYLGILRSGLVAVPISHKFPAKTIQFILEDASVQHIFCDAPHRGVLTSKLPITDFDVSDAQGFDSLLDEGGFESFHPGDDDVAMILYTSGSTGRPKGVPLTHRGHLWALRERVVQGWPFNHHRLLIAAPLYHMNALCNALFGFFASTSDVLLPEFNARRYLEAIHRHRCTWITSVPTMMAMALREEDLISSLDFSSVKVVRMGSAPITEKLWGKLETIFPGASIRNGYGTTEAGPIVFGAADGLPVPKLSVGRPMPGVDLKLIDGQGKEADEGVLWHRTPATTAGYLNLPEKTSESFTPDGWYISGDVFRRDGEGAFHFVGRDDDMFVCGGENIYPGEVEGVLMSLQGIEQCCVVPLADEIKGQLPVAFVVRQAGSLLTEDDVKQHALRNAPAYLHPRRVAFVEELPLAGPGKVDTQGLQVRARELWRKRPANQGAGIESRDHR